MNRSELLQSLKEACERQETSMTNLAKDLFVAKNTLSSWFSEQSKEIPFNNLVKLSKLLDDAIFIEHVKDYMFGYDNHLSSITEKSVAAIYLRKQKEERDVVALTSELEEVLSINDAGINDKEIRIKALSVYKELYEEVDIEQDLIIAYRNKFKFSENELRKVGVISV